MLGERLGNWAIYKELGRGGMGRVYLAQEELTGRRGAVKVLASELAQEVGFLQRFQREIEALSKLEHPNIVRFYESGFENGLYFYVMEYVEGQNLEQILEEQKKISWQEVIDISLQVCTALKHAHDHGVIHRDLKPSNLLRTASGVVKLSDFGIAKIFAGGHLTATGGIVGTAEYISPEQAAGKPANKRSDLYSFGVLLYTLLTGRTPFVGPSHLDLLHKHRYAQFDAPRKYVPEIPHELDEIICQLLEKDPAKRPPDALVLGKQIDSMRRKILRKSKLTEVVPHSDVTLVENTRVKVRMEDKEGPATMMSRLVREELDQQNRGSTLSQFFNRPLVLWLCLLACVGIIVWTFWPASPETLYQRGSELMASEHYSDWERGWKEYLQPLNEHYPDHPYQEEVEEFRQKLQAARFARENPMPDVVERIYLKGKSHLEAGEMAQAQKTWQGLVRVFDGVEGQEKWVENAQQGLLLLEKTASNEKHWKPVRQALDHAKELQKQGNHKKAQAILQGIEDLYGTDPTAREILKEVRTLKLGASAP